MWQLNKETKDGSVPEKIAVYQHANKEVMILASIAIPNSETVLGFGETYILLCWVSFLLQVAIICNHQRSVSKSHSAQMSRLNEKMDELKVACITYLCSFTDDIIFGTVRSANNALSTSLSLWGYGDVDHMHLYIIGPPC